jgi:hypothetical protein
MPVDGERGDSDSVVLRRSQVVLGALGALVLLALNVVQCAFEVDPRLRPDPNERLGADVRVTTVEPLVRRIDYLERVTAPSELQRAAEEDVRRTMDDPHLSRAELCREYPHVLGSWGYVVYAEVKVDGLKRRHVEISGTLYDGAIKDRLEEYGYVEVPPRKLTSPTDSFVETVYVSLPSEPRASQRYLVQLELRTERDSDGTPGTLLATARSKPFAYFEPKRLPPGLQPQCADQPR